MLMTPGILFFADKLPPLVGGMELHADYFIKHFKHHKRFPLLGVVTKNKAGQDYLMQEGVYLPLNIKTLQQDVNPLFVFFNSGRWIEEMSLLRQSYPDAKFIYRTGGNEILKAPLNQKKIPNHLDRQRYWVECLNTSIDQLITNSAFTENRLRNLGLTCPLFRSVGGVDLEGLTPTLDFENDQTLKLFCAARFVPYKNHVLLIDVIERLIIKNPNIELSLSGDGPLKEDMEQSVRTKGLGNNIKFLGTLENKKVCQEIAKSDIYIQLSCDYLTEVEGGSYIHSEGMGRSILEAISAGTYVIAGRSGALSEIVTPERGLLVDLNDVDEIAAKIEPLIQQKPPRLPFYQGYCWSEVFKKYEMLMENYVENTPCH